MPADGDYATIVSAQTCVLLDPAANGRKLAHLVCASARRGFASAV